MAREKDNIALSDEHNSRGIELADRGWLDEAIKEFKKAIDLDPSSAHAHDNLATVYAEKKLYREALTEYLTAIRLEPDSATAHYNLACFLSSHATEMAIAEYKEAIDLDPEYPDAHLNLGLTYADHGRMEDAMKELNVAIDLDPQDAFPRHELAALHMDEGDYRSAITQLKEVVRLEPDNFEAHLDLGICYAQKGFYAEAERSYEKARALNGEDLLLNYNLAALYALWDRSSDAITFLKKALALDRQKVLSWLSTDPMFDSLKSKPEFESLLWASDGWSLALAGILVLANGFFVATEYSLVKLRRSRLQALVAEGRAGAARLLEMQGSLDRYLSATQFGITLASLGLGWVGEPAFASLMMGWLQPLFPEGGAAEGIAHTTSFVLAFAVITFLHIVLGEQVPKNLGIRKAEPTAFAVAAPMRAVFLLFYPGVWVLSSVSNAVLRLLGVRKDTEGQDAHGEEELRVIFTSSAEAGAIAHSRAELLERALAMLEKTARQVMVPRSQVRFLDLDEPLDKNIAEARAGGHTVLPVCRGGLDNVQGMVNVKDVFFLLSRGELRDLGQVQRPVLFVPETISLEQLLSEYKRSRRQLAVVVDEHGGTSGIVTIADVVAELVGNVAELGRKVEEVKLLPGGRFELPGTAQLDDLRERLDMEFDLKDDEVSTIAGFLMVRLGKVPEKGDRVTVGHYEVRVEEVDGPRVNKVRVEPKISKVPVPPAPPGAASGPKS